MQHDNKGDADKTQGMSLGKRAGLMMQGATQQTRGLQQLARGNVIQGAKTYAAGSNRITAGGAEIAGTVAGAKIGGSTGAKLGNRFGRAVASRAQKTADKLDPEGAKGMKGMDAFEPLHSRGQLGRGAQIGGEAEMSIGGRQ